jgi:hypothetical protein
MGSPVTDIRLITIGDAAAITEHIRRDRETEGRWEPAYPPDYFTLDGQRPLAHLHCRGLARRDHVGTAA